MTKTNFVESKNVDSFVDEQGNLSAGENLYQQNKLAIKVPERGKTDKGGWEYKLHIIDLPEAFAEVSVNNIHDGAFAGAYMLDYKAVDTDKINTLKWVLFRSDGKNAETFKAIRVSGINKSGDHLKRLARVLVIDSPEKNDIGKVKLIKMGPSLFEHYKKAANGDAFESITKRNPHRCTMTIKVKEGLSYTELYSNVKFSDELSDADMAKRVAMVPKDAITLAEVIKACPEYFNPSDSVKTRILETAGFDLDAIEERKASKKVVDHPDSVKALDDNTAKDENGNEVPF